MKVRLAYEDDRRTKAILDRREAEARAQAAASGSSTSAAQRPAPPSSPSAIPEGGFTLGGPSRDELREGQSEFDLEPEETSRLLVESEDDT